MNIRNISLSLFLLIGISHASQAMQGGCLPSELSMLYTLATCHPVATVVIGGGAYVGYKAYDYFTPSRTKELVSLVKEAQDKARQEQK